MLNSREADSCRERKALNCCLPIPNEDGPAEGGVAPVNFEPVMMEENETAKNVSNLIGDFAHQSCVRDGLEENEYFGSPFTEVKGSKE